MSSCGLEGEVVVCGARGFDAAAMSMRRSKFGAGRLPTEGEPKVGVWYLSICDRG